MDLMTAQHLSELTSAFYRGVSQSFSATRQTGWPGWRHVVEAAGASCGSRVDVLDVACGNLRFERYLASCGIEARAWAIDACDELVEAGRTTLPDGLELSYQHLDVMEALFSGEGLVGLVDAPPCDLAVCFGFMHHVPLYDQRLELLRTMLAHVRPGGLVAVSFWQFLRDERLRAKARPVEGGDGGDYLLGWQDRVDVARYCHSFSEEEIDELVARLPEGTVEVDRFSADGKSQDLNRYVLLRASEGWRS